MVWITSALDSVLSPTTIALGNFDGVHRGHQRVIAPILNGPAIDPSDSAAEPGSMPVSTVVSFSPHPKAFFSGRSHPLLTPMDEKAQVLDRLGIEQFVVLPFGRSLADLTPEDFTVEILIRGLQARAIAVGADFHFGRGRSGTADRLREIAAEFGVPVKIVSLMSDQEGRISSSRIRAALLDGDLYKAQELLGRPYAITGRVEAGQQLGRQLGFPTANLAISPEKLLPRLGVYAVRVTLADGSVGPGVTNVGRRPTVGEQAAVTVEVHLLDWSGDLYGQWVTIELVDFLRPEQRFASLADLKTQIEQDREQARDRLTAVPLS